MDKALANGMRICYESIGEGTPIVAIAGRDSSMHSWPPAVKAALSRGHRLIVFDHRGTGQSDKPEAPYSIADLAKDVVGLMDALGIDKAHLLGMSMGGMIAQEIAISSPRRVAKLVLCSTTCGPTRLVPSWRMIKAMSRKPSVWSPRDTIDMLYTPAYQRDNPQLMAALTARMQSAPPDRKSMAIHRQASKCFDSLRRLWRIAAPTLIVHGEEDWVFRPRHAKLLHRRIPGSKLLLVPRAGHGVLFQEADAVTASVVDFLDS